MEFNKNNVLKIINQSIKESMSVSYDEFTIRKLNEVMEQILDLEETKTNCIGYDNLCQCKYCKARSLEESFLNE